MISVFGASCVQTWVCSLEGRVNYTCPQCRVSLFKIKVDRKEAVPRNDSTDHVQTVSQVPAPDEHSETDSDEGPATESDEMDDEDSDPALSLQGYIEIVAGAVRLTSQVHEFNIEALKGTRPRKENHPEVYDYFQLDTTLQDFKGDPFVILITPQLEQIFQENSHLLHLLSDDALQTLAIAMGTLLEHLKEGTLAMKMPKPWGNQGPGLAMMRDPDAHPLLEMALQHLDRAETHSIQLKLQSKFPGQFRWGFCLNTGKLTEYRRRNQI